MKKNQKITWYSPVGLPLGVTERVQTEGLGWAGLCARTRGAQPLLQLLHEE